MSLSEILLAWGEVFLVYEYCCLKGVENDAIKLFLIYLPNLFNTIFWFFLWFSFVNHLHLCSRSLFNIWPDSSLMPYPLGTFLKVNFYCWLAAILLIFFFILRRSARNDRLLWTNSYVIRIRKSFKKNWQLKICRIY